MHDLCLLTVIVTRENSERFIDYFRERGIATVHGVLCQGTASAKLLSLMGLEKTGKSLIYVMAPRERAKRLMAAMVSKLGLDMPGNGIAFTVPVGSIAGASSLKYMTEGQEIIIGEVEKMASAFRYELLLAIMNRGHVDTVMDAAREAGAMGGTVIHAKGTNPFGDNRFFGVSIAEEKDMLLILTAARDKSVIMRSIMDKAGVNSPAHTVMFTLPVESVAGLKSVMEAAGETDED